VLVIEDHDDLRRCIAGQLSESYQVIEAVNGLEGYQIAIDSMPDVVISDIMMPHLDGLHLCERLKRDERTSHIPIILLTAKADIESKLTGLETGADDYLTKPFVSRELLLRVQNLIERQKKIREKFGQTLTLEPLKAVSASTEERFLNKVVSIIEQNIPNAAFDIEAFSREVGMSRSQLTRKLTAVCEHSPNELLRSMRLKRAAQLLQQSNSTIAEIAFMVGFSNPNYFTKCFRDQYGVTPSEYVSSTPIG
jgi:DNA-binding response OmpR family regulator